MRHVTKEYGETFINHEYDDPFDETEPLDYDTVWNWLIGQGLPVKEDELNEDCFVIDHESIKFMDVSILNDWVYLTFFGEETRDLAMLFKLTFM